MPIPGSSWVFAIWLLWVPSALQAQGDAPAVNLNSTDVYASFGLPALKDKPTDALYTIFTSVQVAARAKALSLNGQSAVDAWTMAESTVVQVDAWQSQIEGQGQVNYGGGTASGLNQVLADPNTAYVRITSQTLDIDQAISVPHNGIYLDLGSAIVTSSRPVPYMIRVEGVAQVVVANGMFLSGNSAILVNGSTQVIVRNHRIQNLSGDGIVVTGGNQVLVAGNTVTGVKGVPILFHRGTILSVARDNIVQSNLNPSNFTAGIVLSDREVNVAADPTAILGPDGYWAVVQPISSRLNPPHDNVVLSNRVTGNLSSGIYSDGGVRNVFVNNLIAGNGKEGLCLDYGSTANVVAGNTVQQNGKRWGESDHVMALDGISQGGRLPDGTPAEKVPGISIDNALYNIVLSNNVQKNFGGGVKMVRTSYYNVIGLNSMFSNNEGEGPVYHFFGVELGSAGGGPAPDIDFLPSRGNIVFSNSIRGKHYSGVFFDLGSDSNDILDNVIHETEHWALESLSAMQNNTQRNLTNVPSRNISPGIAKPVVHQ